MHDIRAIFRNSLLLCAIVADFCSVSIVEALDVTYELGGTTKNGTFIPNPAGSNSAKTVYSPSSAARMPNGTAIPYGIRGTLRTSSRFFKQLLVIEAGAEVLDWISSQYNLQTGQEITPQFMLKTEIFAANYVSQQAFSNTCNPAGRFDTLFEAASDLQECIFNDTNVQNACNSSSGYCTSTGLSFNQSKASITVNYYNQNGQYWGGANGSTSIVGQNVSLIGNQKFFKLSTLGEPTIAPDPAETGNIIEAYAGRLGGWGDFVSPNVQILDIPIRWTELPAPAGTPTVDTVTDLIRDPTAEPKPPAVIPDPEPLNPDPDGLKKLPNPLLDPTNPTVPNPPPAVRSRDLIGGGMTVTTTYIITNNATKVELNLENKEITYTPDDSELEVPADLTVEEIESNLPRLKIPMLEPERLVDAAFNAAGGFTVQDILDDKTSSCPPPRDLAIIGGAKVQMPFDPLCDFLAMIKKVFVPVVGWIIFLMWIRRIGSS